MSSASSANSNAIAFPPLTPGLILAHVFFAFIVFAAIAASYGFASHDGGVLESMAFYGVYHSDPTNQLIHFFFVPCILWSLLIVMAHVPLLPVAVSFLPGIPTHAFSWASVAMCVYIVYYVAIDIVGALFYLPILYAMYWTAVTWHQADQKQAKKLAAASTTKTAAAASWTGTGRLIKRAWLLHLAGWYFQIHPGHKIFEGSQPALVQSLGGALTSAPLFAFYEGVWALGIRRELQQTVLVRVEELRRDLCAQGVQMRKCQAALTDADTKTAKVEL